MKSNTKNSDTLSDSSDKAEWLLVIRSSNEDYQEYALKSGQNNIGRDGDSDIVLQDPAVSTFHAEVHLDQAKDIATIQDKESTNGTFVNSKRVNKAQTLHHEDNVRVGSCLITINHFESTLFSRKNTQALRTNVTSDLILESIDHYGVLLHKIGQRLVNMPDLDTAFIEITELIKRMIAAEKCQIIMAEQFDELNNKGVPVLLAQKTIKNKIASIFSNTQEESHDSKDEITTPTQPTLLVPVMIDENVVALIFARKSKESLTNFFNSDLQVVLAISNQVAMSIQRYRVEKELLHNSTYDSLTNLPNRDLFLKRLSQSLVRSKKKNGTEFAVLFFDIDDFKVVNDSLGHAVGDKLLVAMAERLVHNIRNVDLETRKLLIARFGGDEFAILLENIKDNRFALAIAKRLKETLSKPFRINGEKMFSTVSIGIAMSTIGYDNPDDILQDADIAMYQAKKLGKSRVEIYNKSMRDRALERMHIKTVIRQDALHKEFQVYYQPIISLDTERIVGFEALLRWYTSDRGVLSPDDFMYAIDTESLIYSTDQWVLQKACSQIVEWGNKFSSSPPLFISVNLSAKNIKHPNLVKNIDQVLQELKLEPDRLCLEITEKASALDDENAIEVLKKLRSIGVRISLDDFGTGYSELNYLARLPVDTLKIDRSFIKMIKIDEDSQKIIEMIKALATHLGINIVAEGVEKIEQIEFLKSINCEYAQGFFYSKPKDAKTITELLDKGYQWKK